MSDGKDPPAFSNENVLNRLASARAQATKDANRLFLASLMLMGLFVVKASGLRVDLTLFDTNVAKVPHGLFFFLVASQVAIILCYVRTGDAAALDSRITSAAKSLGEDEKIADTFVNEFEWFSATNSEYENRNPGSISRIFFNTTAFITSMTGLVFYLLPIIAGIYTLYNYETLIVTGNVTLQYWTLLATTLLSLMWFVCYITVHSVMIK